MNNTLILLSTYDLQTIVIHLADETSAWDEYEDEVTDFFHDHHNVVSSLLLGDAIPPEQHNTTQVAITEEGYSHYSILSTVERNWDLGDLGGGDKGAEPFW